MILFITGPSGAGKSTLARAWVEAKKREIALIDADQITSWLRNGEKSAVEVAFEEGPVERIAAQYRITGKVYAAAEHLLQLNPRNRARFRRFLPAWESVGLGSC